MIKIELNNITSLQLEYRQAVGPDVRRRLAYLQTALEHILDHRDVRPPAKHLLELGTVMKKIIKLVLKKSLPDYRFDDKHYRRTVLLERPKIIAVTNIDPQAVLDLVKELSDSSNGKLDHLLTCRAEDLFRTNEDLINIPKKLDKPDLQLLKLAFDYQAYDNVTDKIKSFFRAKNFVNYCPYCNQDPAMYSGLANGKSARVHQLDHFFDKKTNPLLCYSLFNLVPGDWNCNSVNKGTKEFRDHIHLNPYIDGFGKTMIFEPDYQKAGQQMIKIALVVDKNVDMKRKKQLLGSKLRIDESNNEGNINVFALEHKYNMPHVKLEAGRVHKKFLDNLNNQSTLKDFLNQIPVRQAFDQYKYWYEQEIRTPFESQNFNDQRYSKLFRDIHDFVVDQDANPDNQVIQDIIKKYS